jgi:hypothetical protein
MTGHQQAEQGLLANTDGEMMVGRNPQTRELWIGNHHQQ